MAVIALKSFAGEIPRVEPYLLPDTAAQQAVNCRFSSGAVEPLKNGTALATMSGGAFNIRGIYTEDGTNFFTWSTAVRAWKGPVIGDTYQRVYWSDGTNYKVAQYNLAGATGGEPSTSYIVGVPRPAAAPSLVVVNRTTWPGGDTVTVDAKAYTVDLADGTETLLGDMTQVTAFRAYSYTVATSSLNGKKWKVVITVTNTTKGSTLFKLIQVQGEPSYAEVSDSIPGGVSIGSGYGGKIGRPDISRTPSDQVKIQPVTRVIEGETGGTVSGGNTIIAVNLRYGTAETRSYVYTLVNQWGEESEPSPPTLVAVDYLQNVQLTWAYDTNVDDGYVPVDRWRVYRTLPTGQYVSVTNTTINVPGSTGTATYTDDQPTIAEVTKILDSAEWFLPPTGLNGLTLLPNGFFAGFKNETLYFSEPYRPHAWPHSMSFPYKIRGIQPIESSLLVTTDAYPYLVSGVHPAAMSQMQLQVQQAGVNNRSMATLEGAAVYVSSDGLVTVGGGRASLESSQMLFTRALWRSLYGANFSTMHMAVHDGQLVVANETAGKSFMVRLDEGGGTYTRLDPAFYAHGTFVLPQTDQLYYSVGNVLYTWDTGTNSTMTWWSKDHIFPNYVNFSIGFIACEGATTVSIYADGVLRHEVTTTTGYFRLPAGLPQRRWSVKISGAFKVKEVYLAGSPKELAGV